jgi:hypothetical protein
VLRHLPDHLLFVLSRYAATFPQIKALRSWLKHQLLLGKAL